MSLELHPYQRCTHTGRHGYTLPGDPAEYELCERCRRRPSEHHPEHRAEPVPVHSHPAGVCALACAEPCGHLVDCPHARDPFSFGPCTHKEDTTP